MATLLFLGASVSQLPAIRHARLAGHRIVAVDGDPDAVAFPLAHVSHAVDFTDVERVIELASPLGIEGVLSICTDRGVVPAAAVAEALGLPGIGVPVARRMTDKSEMRACLAEGGIRQPAHRVVSSLEGLQPALAEVGLPAVMKPVDSGGQRGLFMVGSETDAAAHLAETLSLSPRGAAMLESFVDGEELNVLLAMRGGEPSLLTVSDRLRPSGLGFGVGWIHSFPSGLPAPVLDDARELAFAAVRRLGLQDGIAFPQLIVSDDGVFVVEVAARIAAGQMSDLARLGTGIDLSEIAIAQALGREVPDELVAPRFVRPIAIRFLTAQPGILPLGTVTAVEGLDAVRGSPGVLDCGLYFGVGARIRPLQVDADRNGYVIATGANPTEALEHANAASRKLVVRTDETDQHGAGGLVQVRRPQKLALALAAALLLATGAGLVLTEAAKLQRPLVTGTRVDDLFAPLCRCAQEVAHLRFRLTRRARVTIEMVTQSGTPVTRFVRDRLLGPGLVTFVWSGRRRLGRPFPDGSYLPQIDFVTLHRLFRLPSPIRIDDRPPTILRVAVHAGLHLLRIRYTFDEAAYARLLADGKQVILTRFAPRTGTLTWTGRRRRLTLQAIDLAGNRSRPRPIE
jgi:biotin carboxylase